METFVQTFLLVMALVLPVLVFWLLKARARMSTPPAAVIAIAAGWGSGFAWAYAARESTALAARFGWACPTVLVLLTWLIMRFVTRRHP